MPRIGPQMCAVQMYVQRAPGHYMRSAAVFVGPSQRFGYATVHRAIRAGLVKALAAPRGAKLYLPDYTICQCGEPQPTQES